MAEANWDAAALFPLQLVNRLLLQLLINHSFGLGFTEFSVNFTLTHGFILLTVQPLPSAITHIATSPSR